VTRTLEAPRETAWGAWTDPEQLARWWWPARFRSTHEVDLRVGGRYDFRSAELPDLGVLAVSGVYREVREPERLVYSWQWDGEQGPPTQVTVDILDRSGRTEVSVTHDGFASEEEARNHVVGWNDCIDRLDALLASRRLG
jgi:uncharacterized protein YndB with AHSA1/START domain